MLSAIDNFAAWKGKIDQLPIASIRPAGRRQFTLRHIGVVKRGATITDKFHPVGFSELVSLARLSFQVLRSSVGTGHKKKEPFWLTVSTSILVGGGA